jgi:hypothetical protein
MDSAVLGGDNEDRGCLHRWIGEGLGLLCHYGFILLHEKHLSALRIACVAIVGPDNERWRVSCLCLRLTHAHHDGLQGLGVVQSPSLQQCCFPGH